MQKTFKEHLISEADETIVDPEVKQQRENERKLVNLTSQIRSIMQNMDLAADIDPEDIRGYTPFDLYLALDTVEGAIADRTSTAPDEHKGDDKQNYSRLWHSIEEETKDALHTLFQVQSHQRIRYPRFLNDFNRLVVARIFEALKLQSPQQAASTVNAIVRSAKAAVTNNLTQYTDQSRSEAQQNLRKYNQAHQKYLRSKDTTTMSRQDRLNVIRDTARRIKNEDAAAAE